MTPEKTNGPWFNLTWVPPVYTEQRYITWRSSLKALRRKISPTYKNPLGGEWMSGNPMPTILAYMWTGQCQWETGKCAPFYFSVSRASTFPAVGRHGRKKCQSKSAFTIWSDLIPLYRRSYVSYKLSSVFSSAFNIKYDLLLHSRHCMKVKYSYSLLGKAVQNRTHSR